jgi:uncharacterized protein (TIGR02246 family)
MTDEQIIRDTIARWIAASRNGDHATLASILDDDVSFIVPSRPAFGKAEFFAAGGKPFKLEAAADIKEVVVNGDWALTALHLTVAFAATERSDLIHMAGPVMSVWRKASDGSWRLWRDANMVAPVAQP